MNLPATNIDADEIAALRRSMGVDPTADRGMQLPELKVMLDDEDANGQRLPKGSFYIKGHGTENVYAKEVNIRVMAHHFQYVDFDGEAKKVRNKTILATSFRSDFPDVKGTLRCGRPASKVFKELSDEAKKKYESITCYRILRGIISYEGETQSGEKVKIENVPFIVRLKGSNFMGFDEEFASKLQSGRDLWDYWTTLSLERKKNGSVTYFVFHYAPQFQTPAVFDMPTVETIRAFSAMVSGENDRIMESHRTALTKAYDTDEIYDTISGDLEGDLQDVA